MKISTSTNIYYNRPNDVKTKIEDIIVRCSEAGYKILDFNFHDLSMFDSKFQTDEWEIWLESLTKVAKDHNIKFKYGHSHFYEFCDTSIENKEELNELIRRSIVGANILGIEWLVIHACTDFNSAELIKSSKEKTIEFMRPYLQLAQSFNIGIAFENLWDLNISPKKRYTSNAEELVDLVDTLSNEFDNVGICWDFEHSGIMQQDIESELALVGDRLKMIHISDYTSIDNDHILPFEGLIDWYEVMKVLATINFKGDFNYEIHRYMINTPEELVTSKLEYSIEVAEHLINKFNDFKMKMEETK